MDSKIQIFCDNKLIPLPELEGITIINIPSQAGGADYWGNQEISVEEALNDSMNSDTGNTNFQRQAINDQLIEVIGLKNALHLGQCIIGLDRGIKLCQGKKIRVVVRSKEPVPLQIDGEPVSFTGEKYFSIEIIHRGQIMMLKKVETKENLIERKCYQVLDWAMNNQHISDQQRLLLTNELSRRISKIC